MEECVFRVNKTKTKTCCLLMWPWFGSRCFWGCLLLVLTRAVLPGCREWELLTSCQKNLLLGTAFVSPPEVRLRFSKCGRLYLAQLLFNSKIQHSLPCLTAARALNMLCSPSCWAFPLISTLHYCVQNYPTEGCISFSFAQNLDVIYSTKFLMVLTGLCTRSWLSKS